jgi:protoporphyrinogen oxidase
MLFDTYRAISRKQPMSRRVQTLIVGAGLTGLSTAIHLDAAGLGDYLVVESEDRPGGWAKTDWTGAYGVDRGVHVLYFRNPAMQRWVAELLNEQWVAHSKHCLVDRDGIRTPFPFHANLFGRSADVVKDCLLGLLEANVARREAKHPPATFDEWIDLHYGAGVKRHFMTDYNTKMWTVPPSTMGWDWMRDFVPEIDLERIVAGALSAQDSRLGLNAHFYYPRGGISQLSNKLAAKVDAERIFYRATLVEIDAVAKHARLADNTIVNYDVLVSTTPLNVLVDMLAPLPPHVAAARERLEAVDLTLVDIAMKDPLTHDVHWVYLADRSVLSHRLYLCHALSDEMAPRGEGLYCLEIAHSRWRPLPTGDLVARVTEDLVRAGWLKDKGSVTFSRVRTFRSAYVLPRPGFLQDSAVLRAFLRQHAIWSVGRYGEWKYSNVEDALLDGQATAARLSATRSNHTHWMPSPTEDVSRP